MKIGCNWANGMMFSGYKSSFHGVFTDEKISIQNGIEDIVHCIIGDVDDAYEMLKKKVAEKKPQTEKEIAICVYETVNEYFGDYSNVDKRRSFYPSEDDITDDNEYGKISDLKGKNAAMCVEKAALSQNLLRIAGIDSYYKVSGILMDNQTQMHSYNVVKIDDKGYIFDSTMPSMEDGLATPLICVIPDNVYQQMVEPIARVGYSVDVSFYTPLVGKNHHIVYDSGRGEKITMLLK